MPRIFLVGDSIPVKFELFVDQSPSTPTAATIDITDPDGTLRVNAAAMAIDDHVITYTLADSVNDKAGSWKFVAKATKPNAEILHSLENIVVKAK